MAMVAVPVRCRAPANSIQGTLQKKKEPGLKPKHKFDQTTLFLIGLKPNVLSIFKKKPWIGIGGSL
jgi:hypothetical protein